MVINRYIFALFFVSAVSFCGDDGKKEADNLFIAAVVNQVNKVSKKSIHKSPVEYRQAVERYISVTRLNSLTGKGKKVSYEIELQYLFDNFARFSTVALLYRLRLAHCDMVKNITDVHSERYRYYEQICSALLLQCTQMLSDNARKQLLDALHEIDDHIVYWRYQKSHPLSYCFGKSPLKWVMGKKQEKEVSDNIKRFERRQAELYIIVGKLTTHVHSFTECDVHYTDCYTWIEELLSVLSCIKIGSEKIIDGTRFDKIAAQLELKIKQVGNLKYNSLCTIASAKKSNHLVRHWIAYTAVLAVSAYAMHYYIHNYGAVNKLIGDRSSSIHKNWYELVVKPSHDVWETFFGEVIPPSIKHSVLEEIKKDIDELEKNQGVNKKASDDLKETLDLDHKNTQRLMKNLLDKFVKEQKPFTEKDAKENNITYYLTQEKCNEIIAAELVGNIAPFQKLVHDMNKYLYSDLVQRDEFVDSVIVFAELKIYHYGSSVISIVFELIVDYGIPVVKQVLNVLAMGNAEWAAAFKKVNLILNVAALTPTIIVGWAGCNGLSKIYKRATKRNYTPIRIALADVNSLLIESPMPLDDYDYGKLVYLVHKLRNKAHSLKDALCNEFLVDITKLESKRFDVAAKRGIVDNMFNKYAFLGRIAV